MAAPQDHDVELIAGGGSSAVVIRNKARILELFCERVQTRSSWREGQSTSGDDRHAAHVHHASGSGDVSRSQRALRITDIRTSRSSMATSAPG